MGNYRIAVIPGDGIGPEVVNGTCEVLLEIGRKFGHTFRFDELLAGGSAIDATGDPLPAATLAACKRADAVLLGAVGGPKWDTLPGKSRPEKALLGLREGLGLYANLRPAVLFPQLAGASPLKEDLVSSGIDVLIVRELTGGIYFGDRGRRDGGLTQDGIAKGEEAYDTEAYSVLEIERIVRLGLSLSRGRDRRAVIVDKANILESSRLWREVTERLHPEYEDVQVEYMYVDNASMQLVRRPSEFDVIITSNMFGDILSDEAGMITGSIGMLPSASLGAPGQPGMYEPVHGSAPDIAGKNLANPLATILSAAMMLRWSFSLENEAKAIENAVSRVLSEGYRTKDIAYEEENVILGTKEMTEKVILSIV